MSAATCAERSATVNPVHNADGRFAKGNKGGPGNPFGRRLAANRGAILNVIDIDAIEAIMAKLMELAMEGDKGACKMILEYAVGKPQKAKEPDLVDVDEFEVAKAKRVPYSQAMVALLDMPVEKATELAGDVPVPGLFGPATEEELDAMDQEELKEIREAEVHRAVGYFMMKGVLPPDCPFATIPDGAGPRDVREIEDMRAEFQRALREAKRRGATFPPFGDGAAKGTYSSRSA